MHDISELERSLPERLRRSAEAITPDPDALASVRARAATRSRRRRVATAVTSAAAAVAVIGAVVVASGDGATTGVAAGPSDGSDTTTTAVAPVGELDATLVIYRYQYATHETIDGEPSLGSDQAMLHTASRTYFSGPFDGEPVFDETAAWEEGHGDAFSVLDTLHGQDPADAIERLLDLQPGVTGSVGLPAPDVAPERVVAGRLMQLISMGVATAAQVHLLTELLASVEGVEVHGRDDGTTQISDEADWNGILTYETATGRPLRWVHPTAPAADMEYVSVTRVRAADHLTTTAGDSQSSSESTTTTMSTTTTVTTTAPTTAAPTRTVPSTSPTTAVPTTTTIVGEPR